MPSKKFPPDTLEQVLDVLDGCKQIDPRMRTGTLTQEELAAEVVQVRDFQSQINQLEKQISALRDKRDDRLAIMWEAIKRTRTTVRGLYGDDSSEYKLVGGTRMSERKKPVRKEPA